MANMQVTDVWELGAGGASMEEGSRGLRKQLQKYIWCKVKAGVSYGEKHRGAFRSHLAQTPPHTELPHPIY